MEDNIQKTIIDELSKNNEFLEIRQFDKKDLKKIYEMYIKQKKYIDVPKKIDLYRCIYEVVKDNLRYHSIIPKIEYLYERSLDSFLSTIHYNNQSGFEINRGSYDLLKDQSFVLIEIITKQLKASIDQIIFMGTPEFYSKVSSRLAKLKRIQKELGYTSKSHLINNIELLIDDSEKINSISDEVEKEIKQLELYTTLKDTDSLYTKLSNIKKQVSNINIEMSRDLYGVSLKSPAQYDAFLKAKESIKKEEEEKKEPNSIQEKNKILKEKVEFYESKFSAYKDVILLIENEQYKTSQNQELETEQEKIYNLIFSEENERLKNNNSIYTAWDLSDKVIPPKYQGMTYEQVETMINQEKVELKAQQETKEERETLINQAIRKDLGVSNDYYLNDIQIKNLRVEFDRYTNEELKDFVAGVKKEPTIEQNIGVETRKLEPLDFSSLLDKNENVVQRTHLINKILEYMYPNGVDYVPLPDIKKQLESKSNEELQTILNQFNNEVEPSKKTL